MNKRINSAVTGVVTGAVVGLAGVAQAAAQTKLQDKFFPADTSDTDIASAGNGGVATAAANGGAASIGDINSGGNVCNAIGIGNTYGYVPVDPQVYGGDCANLTAIDVAVDG